MCYFYCWCFSFLIRFVGWNFVFPKTNPVSCLLNENMLKKLGKHIQKIGIIFCISWLTQSSLGSWIWYLNLEMMWWCPFPAILQEGLSLSLSAPSYQNHLTAVSCILFSLLAAFGIMDHSLGAVFLSFLVCFCPMSLASSYWFYLQVCVAQLIP